jgi:hypothetical protein
MLELKNCTEITENLCDFFSAGERHKKQYLERIHKHFLLNRHLYQQKHTSLNFILGYINPAVGTFSLNNLKRHPMKQ